MSKEPTKKELDDMMHFQVLSVEDLPRARRHETFLRWCMRNDRNPSVEKNKLDYLIYKHELDL